MFDVDSLQSGWGWGGSASQVSIVAEHQHQPNTYLSINLYLSSFYTLTSSGDQLQHLFDFILRFGT